MTFNAQYLEDYWHELEEEEFKSLGLLDEDDGYDE